MQMKGMYFKGVLESEGSVMEFGLKTWQTFDKVGSFFGDCCECSSVYLLTTTTITVHDLLRCPINGVHFVSLARLLLTFRFEGYGCSTERTQTQNCLV